MKFIFLVLSVALMVACSQSSKKLSGPSLDQKNRSLAFSDSQLKSYDPDSVRVSSSEGGIGRKFNAVQIFVDQSVIADETVRWDDVDVKGKGIAEFLNLKLFEAKQKGRNILINYKELQSLEAYDDGSSKRNGQRFIRSIIIQGYTLDNLLQAGVLLELKRISMEPVRRFILSDYLSILVDEREIIQRPMSWDDAVTQLNSFERFRGKAIGSGEMIYFDLSKIYDDPDDFMAMFKRGSDVFGSNHELLQKK